MRTCWSVSLSCLLPVMLTAQDTHYWGSQYGTAGFFLPGAVVAWNGDSSVLFYNPALLVHSNGPRISANANIYYLEKINLRNGAGTGRDLRSTSSGSLPQLLSGNFRLPGKRGLNIAYALISNNVLDYEATQRRDEALNVLNDSYSPGDEFFVGQLIAQNSVRTFSGLAGVGIPLTRRLSAGIYVEGTYRKHKYELNYLARALTNPPASDTFSLVSTDYDYFVSFNEQAVKFKIGLAWDGAKDHIGLLVQTPSIKVSGKGTLVADEVINNINLGPGTRLSFLANTRQKNLPVQWKTPLSIALGYSRQLPKTILYGAVEYFSRIGVYTIMAPRPEAFIRPATPETNGFTQILLQLKDARKAVWNVGVGGSYQVREKITLHGAFRTDNTYHSEALLSDKDGIEPNISSWNNYHWQAGVNLKKAKYNMRVGLYFSHGRDNNYQQPINFDQPSDDNFLLGEGKPIKATYFASGIMLSYLHNF